MCMENQVKKKPSFLFGKPSDDKSEDKAGMKKTPKKMSASKPKGKAK